MASDRSQKLLDHLRESKRNWSSDDLGTILISRGFRDRKARHGCLYQHTVYKDLIIQIANRKNLAPKYACNVESIINELEKRQSKEENTSE